MIKKLIGGGGGRSGREQYRDTLWTQDIQFELLGYEDTEEAERRERESGRPGPEVKVDVPVPTDAKSIFLEAARLRNKDTKRFGGGSISEQLTKHDLKAVPSGEGVTDAKLAAILDKLSVQVNESDLIEVRAFFDLLKRQMSPARLSVETVLESFDGVLDCVDGETAYVTLTSIANGDVLYGEYPAATFNAKGIEEEDRFICKTVETNGATRIEIEAVPDAELTEDNIRAIRAKIEKVLPRNDPGVKY